VGFLELSAVGCYDALERAGVSLFDLEREALIASGLEDEDRIGEYLAKLDSLYREHKPSESLNSHPLAKARMLFDSLWKDRPNRYTREGQFRFNEVIDAQLDRGNRPVGNCLGLTLLYNCLVKRMGIQAQASYLENAFDIGPHVLTLLRIGNTAIDVENILPDGFDYKGHKENRYRVEWGDKEMVADIYQSAGTDFFEKQEFPEALRNYDLALHLYPEYEKAKLNKAILLDQMAMKG
jgi:tetratricopeptide (TPR) repeat protein